MAVAVAPEQAVRRRLADVRVRVAAAARRGGWPAQRVRVMAVTKTRSRVAAAAALAAGADLVGENRVQEAAAKFARLPEFELHLIGHLQRNKARAATRLFHAVQSIDKLATAEALQRALDAEHRTMDVLLELNTSGEPAKHGFRTADELRCVLDTMAVCDRLRVRGLMTMAAWRADPEAVRRSFRSLRRLFDELAPGRPGFDTLSMGMSADYEIAVEEGATLVRLGSVLFGPRPTP
ncbi:MAG: YggS family pyridoxal phosphate-dependent enzyme [Spirochaetaceae bacterium]|nr:YggS family pyridoxal phosphate-dependent enzyme [Spirochaetaceae bacterium]MDE0228960.1 YggS family pyridoxal phosphate-dependent enzyme [Spirochaetaceae bacterium]